MYPERRSVEGHSVLVSTRLNYILICRDGGSKVQSWLCSSRVGRSIGTKGSNSDQITVLSYCTSQLKTNEQIQPPGVHVSAVDISQRKGIEFVVLDTVIPGKLAWGSAKNMRTAIKSSWRSDHRRKYVYYIKQHTGKATTMRVDLVSSKRKVPTPVAPWHQECGYIWLEACHPHDNWAPSPLVYHRDPWASTFGNPAGISSVGEDTGGLLCG